MNDVKEFTTVRIAFSKKGTARYISHLDLNRTMIRAVRRAKLPVWYTEGFNKHPYVTFASPLSLGFEGERETMDLRLCEELPAEELVSRLDAVMPAGLHVIDAAPAVKKAGEIGSAVYRLTVACKKDTVQAVFARDTVPVQKRTKSKALKTVDLKPVWDAANATLEEENGQTVITLTLPCGGDDSVNPSLLVTALREATKEENLPFFVCRTAVLDKDGAVFR